MTNAQELIITKNPQTTHKSHIIGSTANAVRTVQSHKRNGNTIKSLNSTYEPNGTLKQEVKALKRFETDRFELERNPEYKHFLRVCSELQLSF